MIEKEKKTNKYVQKIKDLKPEAVEEQLKIVEKAVENKKESIVMKLHPLAKKILAKKFVITKLYKIELR